MSELFIQGGLPAGAGSMLDPSPPDNFEGSLPGPGDPTENLREKLGAPTSGGSPTQNPGGNAAKPGVDAPDLAGKASDNGMVGKVVLAVLAIVAAVAVAGGSS